MSDIGRKGLGEQVSEKVTPQSQKSTFQVASENVTGVGDKIMGAVQPSGNKSTTQKVGDSAHSNSDDVQSKGKGILGSVKNTVSSAAGTVTGKSNEATL
ncbi:putative 12 kDa heat shock protein [Tricladium varicosporioides]|nr:putative 12 kDa heat shock protein [Hymenoscyphus varicosporioides]